MGQQRVSSICTECGAGLDFELGASQVRCAHCDAGLAVDKGRGLIRLSCPRCSGNFYYIDGSMSGRCPFCSVPLMALSRDRLLRLIVPPAAPKPEAADGAALMLLPFWHLSGMVFGWDVGAHVSVEEDSPRGGYESQMDGGVEGLGNTTKRDSGPKKVFRSRVVNLAFPDPATRALGVTSLGFRTSVFALEPFKAEHEKLGRVVPTTVEIAQARELLTGMAFDLGQDLESVTRIDCRRLDLVSDELALYYYPFWLRRDQGATVSAWDGVTGEPEPTIKLGDPPAQAGAVFDELKVIELSCKSCGEPLALGNHSVVLPCSSCGQFWLASHDGLQAFEANFATPHLQGSKPVWLPFWRTLVSIRYCQKQAQTVQDLRTILGVIAPSQGTPSEAAPSPLHYFVPAYGAMRAPRLDYAARDMTRTQPVLWPSSGVSNQDELFTCFFGPDDAKKLGYVTWIQLVQGASPHRLRSLRVEPRESSLWYVPFDDQGRELVNLVNGFRYDRSSFRGVRH